MAYQLIEQGHKPNTNWLVFACDTDADIANLPSDAPILSQAIVAKNGNLYLLDSQGNWNPMPGNATEE